MTLGYYIIKGIAKPLSLLPLGFHRKAAKALAWLVEKVVRYRRDEVMINISKSFPEAKYEEIKAICRISYVHFANLLTEAIWFGSSKDKRLRKSKIATIANPELVNSFTEAGKSVVILASHMGNWELFGGIKSYAPEGRPLTIPDEDVCVFYKRLSSKAWDEFIGANRKAPLDDPDNFEGMVETDGAIRYAFANRSKTKIYLINTDQYPYSAREAVDLGIPFMNQATMTMDGGAAFAKLFHLPVVFLSQLVNGDGGYTYRFKTICDDASQLENVEIMQKYYQLLEEDLKIQPWNYLWTHKRWK